MVKTETIDAVCVNFSFASDYFFRRHQNDFDWTIVERHSALTHQQSCVTRLVSKAKF